MRKVRRVIRKVTRPFDYTLDDQLWPINVVLLILGGFITGELLVFGDFTTPVVWQNGWIWLAAVWLAIIGTMLIAWQSSGLMARRTQLSTAMALLMTLFIMTGCYYFRIFTVVEIDDMPRDIVKREEVTMPDYFQVEQVQNVQMQLEHERPVETEAPQEQEETEVERQEVERPQEVQQPQPVPREVPQVQRQAETAPRQREESQQTPPRQSETTGQLSRQVQPTTAQPERVSSPTTAQQDQPKPTTQLQSQNNAISPRQTTSVAQRPTPAETPTTQSEQPRVRSATRPTPRADQPQLSTARPTLPRAVRQPVEVPRVQNVAQRTPARQQETQPSRLQPTQSIQRQSTASPNVARQPQTEPQLNPSENLPRTEQARATPAPRQPTLARTELPSTSRSAQPASTPTNTTAVAEKVAASPQQAPSVQPQPSQPVVQRQTPAQGTAAPQQPTDTQVASSVPTPSTAATRPREATPSSVPSVYPQNEPNQPIRRTQRLAESATSPVAAASPASVQSSVPNPRATQPRVAALSRSRQGMAGAGQQRNLDRGEPAPRTVSEVASAAGRRSRATAEAPDASALTSSAQSRVAKDRAMAEAPSATLQAQAVDVAVAAGVDNPSDVDATSSAAMRNSAAAQTQGAVTADTGSTDFDTGPTQIASEFGRGRAAGGGQPELHHATQTPNASRLAAIGGAELAALDSQAVAPEPTDVPSEGGGRPAAPAADSMATSAARVRDSGATQQASGQPSDQSDAEVQLVSGGAPQVAAARSQRSPAAANAAPGAAVGGGTEQPAREAGVNFAAQTQAAVPTVESTVGGEAQPEGVEAATASLARQGGSEGLRGPTSLDPTGAAESDVAMNVPDFGAPGTRGGHSRASDDGGEPGPVVASATGGAPLKESTQANLPGVAQLTVDEAELAGGGVRADSQGDQIVLGAGEGSVERQKTGGTQVLARAEPGDGGIGLEPSPQVGNPSRKAQRTSEVVTVDTDARFQQRDVGGPITSGNTRARDTQAAFQGRKRSPGTDGQPGSRPRHLEVAIRTGLEFLRIQQADDGSWSFHNYGRGRPEFEEETSQIRADTAATGLSLMCFLGAGYDHFDFGGEYAKEIQVALDYLVTHQQEDGNLYVDQDPQSSTSAALYSHAIAAMALCEAYGMTRDPKLKEPAQKALKYIEQTQHKERGGWRYLPQSSSDLSVTGWMFAALKSGQLAGLEVKKETTDAALAYLNRCQGPKRDAGRYVYNPSAPSTAKQSHGRRPSRSMTAVGLLLRLYEGWDRSKPEMRRGADYLMEQLPEYSVGNRDTYYWYYGTQVMFHMKGHYWETWQRRLHELLRDTQEKSGPMAGSWDPRGNIPDKWGAHGGRIYVTAMNLLSLEVSYRYLPLYVEAEQ